MTRMIGYTSTTLDQRHTMLDLDEWAEHQERTGSPPEGRLDTSMVPWREDGPDGDPGARLRGVLNLGGPRLRLTAYAVHLEVDGILDDQDYPVRYKIGDGNAMALSGCRIEADDRDVDLTILYRVFDLDGEIDTVVIAGRHYAVFAFPCVKGG